MVIPGVHDAQGVGLGLAIARAAVDAQGGRLSAEDSTLGGACFVLVIPECRMTRHSEKPSILAIDDEPQLLEALRTILELRGYRLRAAPSGLVGLDAISAERPDVVLLDLAMPGMNGVEVCRRIRSFSRMPILVLSALTDEPQKVKALDAGAGAALTSLATSSSASTAPPSAPLSNGPLGSPCCSTCRA